MTTSIRSEGGAVVISVDGELVAATVQQFRQQVDELLAKDMRDYVVDFGKVTAMDSAGLEALTWLVRTSEERLGSVALARVEEPFSTILRMTRLDDRFACFESTNDAIASFG